MEKASAGGGGEPSPRSLLTRTVSFLPSGLSLSARARALRDRFANSKRSLSDSWTDQYLLDETSTEVQESPSDNNPSGSTQYLIKSCPGNNTSAAAASVVIDASATQTPTTAYRAACSKPVMQSCSDMLQRTAMPGSFIVSQRSHSLDSLNNINVQNKDEPSGNPATNISFPSPPLLDTPTLSPVHPMQFTFPTFSTLDFSSTTIPRPIKSASFRQISKQQSKDMLNFTNFSTSSLPPHLPPPPKSPIKKITKNEEKHVLTTPPPVQVPSRKTLSTSSSHSNLTSTNQPSSPPVCTNHDEIETNLQRDSSGSMDPEEGRDTVSDSPLVSACHRNTPPSHLLLRSTEFKQKLRHQWSIDETRISKARDREGSDVSCSSTAPLRPAEKRRRFFMRKQPNSAPDSLDGPPITTTIKTKEYHHSVAFCLGNVLRSRNTEHVHQHQIPPPTIVLQNKLNSEPELGVEHLSDLSYPDADPPCHFCCKQTSTAIHDENRLKIVSRGLVRSRDGGREGGGTHYMNLPSPNVQTEENQEDVFKPNVHRPSSSYDDDDFSRRESCVTPPPIIGRRRRTEELDLEEVASTPPSSVLARRRALVPPKLMADNNGDDHDSNDRKRLSSDGTGPRTRRSSIVVIPPMQICPGDLLVYSKVLTQRNNPFDGVNSRKNKNTWSLLKLFDRSNRVKSESMCGLEEVLSCIQRSEFKDEQLSKYRGMSWSEFVVYVDTERDGKCNNGVVRHKSSSSSSSSSSNNHSSSCSPERPSSPVPNPIVATAVVEATPQPTLAPVAENSKAKMLSERPSGFERRLRIGLMRTQSEKSFERRLTSSMWRGMDKPLPERILPRPAPLIPTLSEKDLLGSKEALASPVSTDSRNECKKREALWDLFQSECAFLYDHLMVLKNVFMEPLKTVQVDGFAMFAEPELLFGNLDELCCVTYAFCKEFINLILQNVGVGGEMNSTEILVKLFQKSSKADSVSQAYHCYALNYINALNYLETLRRHMEFCEFEKWCNRDPRCKKLQLTDLLVAPVQHIMKVPLILKEVENRTEEAEERDIIGRILEMEENSLRELDDKMKWLKNFERLLEIQRNIVWPSVFELDPKMYVPEFLKPALARQPCERIIVSPRRQIIMEGPLNLWDSGKPTEMYVVLFDDMLLISRRKKGLSKKKSSLTENWTSSCSRGSGGSGNEAAIRYVVYKQPLSLDRFFIHDVTVPEGSTCRLDAAFVLVSLNRFQQIVAVHTFQAASDQLKQNWLLKLRDTQDKWKRTLQHTVFRSPRVSTCSSRKSTT